MSEPSAKSTIEAALFASVSPLSLAQLARLVQQEPADVQQMIESLQADYAHRGIQLNQVASGYRFVVPPAYSEMLVALQDSKPPRYSRAFMETLALIAYRQPITRGEIEEIRGVAVSSKIIKTLQDNDWIKACGARDVPGKPVLWGTTKGFLDDFNLCSIKALPPLTALLDLEQAEQDLTQQLTMAIEGHKGTESAAESATLQEEEEPSGQPESADATLSSVATPEEVSSE